MADGDNLPVQATPPIVPPVDMPTGNTQQAPPLIPTADPSSGGRMKMPGAGLPNIIQLLAGVLKPQQGTVTPGQAPQRPNSRLDVFENFLGNFLQSFAAGMSQSGQRGAEGKGFAAAIQQPIQRSIQQQEFGLQQRQVESQEGLRQAQEEFNRSRALEYTGVQVPMIGSDGQIVKDAQGNVQTTSISRKDVGSYLSRIGTAGIRGAATTTAATTRAAATVDVANINAAAKVKAATGRTPSDPLYQITRQLNPTLEPGSPEFAAKWEEMRMREKTDPGIQRMQILLQRNYHAVNDAQGNVVGWVNPSTRQFLSGSQIPEMPNAGVVPPKPPGQVIGMAVAAGTMLQHMPEIRQQIIDAANKLGPGAGRWNEFMTGKVGAADPQFTKLRDNISLLQTRLMQAHVGMAGSDKMMEHFKGLIDNGKQSPENMLAAWDVINSYLNTYRGMAPTATGGSVNNIPKAATGSKVDSLAQKYGAKP